MTNHGAAWRKRQGARMDGDGFGSPPWGPADSVPELEQTKDTKAIPGLGSVPGPAESANGQSVHGQQAHDPAGSDGAGTAGTVWGKGGEQDPPPGAHRGKGDDGGKRRRSFWRELPVLIVIALVLALVIKAFAFQAFYIPSGSMQNTLGINDRVLINKIVYHLRPIHRGDIVVFDGTGSWNPGASQGSSNIFAKGLDEIEGLVGISHDSNIYIKRVIGVPGDHVACCDAQGDVTVNGVALHESAYLYPGNKPSAQRFSITVPPGRLWV
ncbi:MAG: signal peptidase I, partial [Trebonia sp.]